MSDLKVQNALPLEEQRIGITPNDSVAATETDRKAEGDEAYLALAKEVRDDVSTFIESLEAAGKLECLINCDDYGDELLTLHLRFAEQYLHRALRRLKSAVIRLRVVLEQEEQP